jgi:chromosomal replication initiator protein
MMHKDFWTSVLKRLQPTIQRAQFLTWFQNTSIIDKKAKTIIVAVPNVYAQDWISKKYELKILQAIQELDKNIKKVKFEVKECEGADVKDLLKESDKKVRKVRNLPEVVVSKGDGSGHVSSQMLNHKYSLNNFVVGQDNRLPHAAATAVSSKPGGIYNPLYIYGKVGLGKTHLVQSIGNQIIKDHPNKIVKYITAERFVSEVVDAIGKRHMAKFKDQYRKVDVFLIDDVQFFANKHSSQQEFFHTFNELYEANKQIVLTSDRQPSELDNLEERLKSRFGMGMVVELLPPDYETRLAILQQKCQEFQAIIDPKVLDFITTNVKSSVRSLEGVLKQVIAESQLTDRVPTIRTAVDVIRRLDKAQEIIGYDVNAKRADFGANSVEEVIDIVAGYYKVSSEAIMGPDRHKEIMIPRQICMYLIKNEMGYSYERIGENFGGRNHTTVMHACSKTSKKLKQDVNLIRDLNSIKREMGL